MPSKSLAEWESISERFYNKYAGLKRWQDNNFKEVCKSGRYESFTGRWWCFHKEPDYSGVLKYSRPAVCNYAVQGIATGDIVPFAMMILRKRIMDEELDAKIICQVHDSIVLDVAKKDVDRCSELVYNTFVGLPKSIKQYWKYDWRVYMTGEVEVGFNYKDLKKTFDKKGRITNG